VAPHAAALVVALTATAVAALTGRRSLVAVAGSLPALEASLLVVLLALTLVAVLAAATASSASSPASGPPAFRLTDTP
jgi:hypothetical protein